MKWTPDLQDVFQNLRVATDREVLGSLVQPCDRGRDYVEGSNNYRWFFAIGQAFRPVHILEIGTRFGYSLRALANGSGQLRDVMTFHVWDCECDGDKEPLKVFEAHFRNELGYRNIFIHREDTQRLDCLILADVVPTGGVDLAVVDADHSQRGAYHDCCLAYEALAPGGVMVVDDTNPGDVRTGCEMFCRERKLVFTFLPSLRGIHIVYKPFAV